ncbi:MAG TPA: hypothetical protein PKA27_00985 [Fimbriimonadaceae bacterium]|nr:hypothetical protein [Fimbriimonadaceae bacterium]
MRSLGITLLFALAAVASAQAPFTIVRPADGSKVREKVNILFPKNSVPSTGYIAIYVGGKFVEAVVPPVEGDYLKYVLDTKGKKIADGKLNIKAVLYADTGERSRIIDTSEIDVEVANSSSIAVPENGLTLRYRFTPGAQYVYKLEQKIGTSNLTENQAKGGARVAELPVDFETLRLLYAVDNAYSNGDGLVRVQALMPKGKDKIIFTDPGDGETNVYNDYDMHSVYSRLSSTGAEVFSSVPRYFPMEGSSQGGTVLNLYAFGFPLPVFPSKAVKPGSFWNAPFQIPNVDINKRDELKSFVQRIPNVRGDFEKVEWEMGHPCAKIKHSYEMGGGATAAMMQRFTGMSAAKIEETIWFALDKRIPIKIQREFTIDRREETQAADTGMQGGGEMGGGGPTAAGASGGPRRGGVSGSGGGGSAGNDFIQGPVRAGASSGNPPQGGGLGRGGRGGEGCGAGGGANVTIVRMRIQQILTLEK